MAEFLPIILKTGELQQIQTGDLLKDPNTSKPLDDYILATCSFSITKGEVFFVLTSGSSPIAVKAVADGSTLYPLAFGLQTLSANVEGIYKLNTGRQGGLSGLTAFAPYFLSASTPGAITTTPPTTTGTFVIKVGVALSTTEMLWKFEQPVSRA